MNKTGQDVLLLKKKKNTADYFHIAARPEVFFLSSTRTISQTIAIFFIYLLPLLFWDVLFSLLGTPGHSYSQSCVSSVCNAWNHADIAQGFQIVLTSNIKMGGKCPLCDFTPGTTIRLIFDRRGIYWSLGIFTNNNPF